MDLIDFKNKWNHDTFLINDDGIFSVCLTKTNLKNVEPVFTIDEKKNMQPCNVIIAFERLFKSSDIKNLGFLRSELLRMRDIGLLQQLGLELLEDLTVLLFGRSLSFMEGSSTSIKAAREQYNIDRFPDLEPKGYESDEVRTDVDVMDVTRQIIGR